MKPISFLKILLTASLTLTLASARAADECCPDDKGPGKSEKPDAHAGHDHAAAAAATPTDEHAGHDHAAEAPAAKPDPHAGHDHAAEAPYAHAGHDHGGEGGDFCGEHNLPETECAICNPEMVEEAEVGKGPKLRLASAESLLKAGVATGAVVTGRVSGVVTVPAEIQLDPARQVRVSAPVAGTVLEVTAPAGTRVKKGDVLARISSREVATLRADVQRAEAAAALARLDEARARTLMESSVGAKSEHARAEAAVRAAEANVAEAAGHLELLGVDAKQAGNSLDLRAPIDGAVVECRITPGARVAADSEAFALADTTSVRVCLLLHPDQIALVSTGAVVRLPGDISGTLDRIDPLLDPVTRRVFGYATLPNPSGALRPGLLLSATVATSSEQSLPLAPVGAVQPVDAAHVVFVKLAEDLFEVRRVTPGPRAGGSVAITAGLAAGEVIALSNTQVLKAELLKSRMGAGCGDH